MKIGKKDLRWIDLTLDYDDQISGYQSSITNDLVRDGWNARDLHIYSHAGTHMDAPFHFGVSSQTIDQIPLEQFMGRAWVVDVHIIKTGQLLKKSLVKKLTKWRAGDSLLIRSGWSNLVGHSLYRDALPRISKGLAKWCVSKKVKMLGVEGPSVADVNNLPEVTNIHEILLGGNVTIIEGITNLYALQRKQVYLIALPLKIKDGDGAPARVIALEKRRSR